MGIFDFLRKSKKDQAIALDIGTEFVKALIFKVENNIAHVIGAGYARQGLNDMQGGVVTNIQGVIKNCQQALEEAYEMAKIMPDQVIIGIAGELVKGMTTTIHYTRSEPAEKITQTELAKIVEKIQKRAFEKAREILTSETGRAELDIKLVNAAIVNVSIDGQKVTNPLGFQGKDISMNIFNAFAPVVHLGALNTIAEELKLDLISVTAEPYAVARSVGLEDAPTDFSGIFLDVGGGTTDIAVVRNGGLEGTKMFALGGRTFTKRLAQFLSVPFDTAEEVKLSYSRGLLDEKSTKKVKKSLADDCQVWISGVELILEEYASELLPAKFLLCGGGSSLPDIKEVLKSKNWRKKLPFAKEPVLEYIRISDVANVVDQTGKLSEPRDITPASLANVALDYMGEQTIVGEVLAKIIRSMRE